VIQESHDPCGSLLLTDPHHNTHNASRRVQSLCVEDSAVYVVLAWQIFIFVNQDVYKNKYHMTVHQPYYCEYCRSRYLWAQERLTPGFCSIKCQASESARNLLVPFEVQQLAKAMESVPVSARVNDVVEEYRQQKASDALKQGYE
jgi:hypothetical protein